LTIEIAIFGDLFMPSSLIKDCLIAKTGQRKGLGICEYEVSVEKQDNVEGVSEYWGDPKKIIANVGNTDILIVHAAPVNAEVMDAAPSLKLIGCCRSGAANVEVSYATKKGIPVLFTPGRNAHGVADLTIGLIICEARGIARADAQMKSGVYCVPEVGVELWGKTLGIIGLGSVGSGVAFRAKNGFNMEVLAYDPRVPGERARELGVKLVDLEKLLRESDFVTVHSRASPDARPQITAKHIAMMKPTAYLINTSRGSIVDEQALVEALENGRIAGAALDVYTKEPVEPDNPLLKLDNVTLTPHVGGITREVPLRTAEIIAEDVARFLKGERPRNVLNAEVFKHQA
jgi:D-3-phosphoglycerate dehydrogenase